MQMYWTGCCRRWHRVPHCSSGGDGRAVSSAQPGCEVREFHRGFRWLNNSTRSPTSSKPFAKSPTNWATRPRGRNSKHAQLSANTRYCGTSPGGEKRYVLQASSRIRPTYDWKMRCSSKIGVIWCESIDISQPGISTGKKANTAPGYLKSILDHGRQFRQNSVRLRRATLIGPMWSPFCLLPRRWPCAVHK